MRNYWATEAIKWAAEKGIVKGYPDGTFKPTKSVTKAEFAAILARCVANTEKTKIDQRQEGKHWAQSIYDELDRWDLPLKGYGYDKVKDAPITRGDVAGVIASRTVLT
ncbi:MAG TPA: S-layer homology domain-containing protein [Thermoanaerobacterales bacterium]|nr:S-layer homology domain-containing protein [Thermoanaerobacterales bacterium]